MQIPTGEDIRAARNNNELTQSELAEKAGVSQPLIARIESGDVDPTIDTLYSIVSVLNDSASEMGQEEVKISMPSALKDARRRKGYTQRELADAAGVSQPLISRIEGQDINPKSSTLRSLFSQLDPVAASPDTGSPMSETTESSFLEKIEAEFDSIRLSSDRPQSASEEYSGEKEHCPECYSELSSYPNPSYCPHCGAGL
ncbi:helix-turn-helix domain-containing protein [Halalkalirubrum salinum]|uniref:helix-turn-helix domain-containing protein n=1 Tax=Halalkalirubrum salinum TaxID=2563889 RepID=UPI001F112B6E|nr:helix-turn-helix domain-containing protein [Halalkalirubrum salinum]